MRMMLATLAIASLSSCLLQSERPCEEDFCAPYTCSASGSCLTGCFTSSSCAEGYSCNEDGQCAEPECTQANEEDVCGEDGLCNEDGFCI